MGKLGVGLYGSNGHQIHHMLKNHPLADLKGVAAFDSLPSEFKSSKVQRYKSLEAMLKDEQIELVSICSPVRRDQARDIILCLEAGKHVYAEKPCAMTEEELDLIIQTAAITGKQFREMSATVMDQPYSAIRGIVQSGRIGEVVQVFAQKSYPYYDARPQNENIDGGLICQAGIHALRFIEQVACRKVESIYAVETKLGNPFVNGELRMAGSLMMTLDNGGVASAIVNYLNHPGFGKWGNESLRIFGTLGFVEAVDGGARTRLVIGETDLGPIDCTAPVKDYLDLYIEAIQGTASMPWELEDELHATRMVIRAKKSANEN